MYEKRYTHDIGLEFQITEHDEGLFKLRPEQEEKLVKWKEARKEVYTGVSGGRYTYVFTPTSLGCIVSVLDNVTNDKLDLTDYDLW